MELSIQPDKATHKCVNVAGPNQVLIGPNEFSQYGKPWESFGSDTFSPRSSSLSAAGVHAAFAT